MEASEILTKLLIRLVINLESRWVDRAVQESWSKNLHLPEIKKLYLMIKSKLAPEQINRVETKRFWLL